MGKWILVILVILAILAFRGATFFINPDAPSEALVALSGDLNFGNWHLRQWRWHHLKQRLARLTHRADCPHASNPVRLLKRWLPRLAI